MKIETDTVLGSRVPVDSELLIAMGLILKGNPIDGTDAKSQPAILRAGKVLRRAFNTGRMTEKERLALQRAVNSISAGPSGSNNVK